jgi:TusA-related sulfurtransferase
MPNSQNDVLAASHPCPIYAESPHALSFMRSGEILEVHAECCQSPLRVIKNGISKMISSTGFK